MTTELIKLPIVVTRYAGVVILGEHLCVGVIELKDDGSPLTLAGKSEQKSYFYRA